MPRTVQRNTANGRQSTFASLPLNRVDVVLNSSDSGRQFETVGSNTLPNPTGWPYLKPSTVWSTSSLAGPAVSQRCFVVCAARRTRRHTAARGCPWSRLEMDPKMVATDCAFDSMLSALSVRAEKGLHLERVHLGLVHDTDDHYPKNEAVYGERLRALVPCVEYFSIGTSELPHVVRRCQVDDTDDHTGLQASP